MSKTRKTKQQESDWDVGLENTSIRPAGLDLAKLAAPLARESITRFLTLAVASRATEILNDNNVPAPAWIPRGLLDACKITKGKSGRQ